MKTRILIVVLLFFTSLARTNPVLAERHDPVQPIPIVTCVDKYQAIAAIYNAALEKNGALLSGEIAPTSPATATVTYTLLLLSRIGTYTSNIICDNELLSFEAMAAQFSGALGTAIRLRLLAERDPALRVELIDAALQHFEFANTAIMGAANVEIPAEK